MAKKLKDCTKDELLYIIKRLTHTDDYHLHRILSDMEYERVKKKLAEGEKWGQIADSYRKRYIELLEKHEGKHLIDVPIEDIKEMEKCLKDAKRADEKYNKCMKEVDAYGT
jgi:hypothetical protein